MNGAAARFLRLGVSLSGLMVLGWVLSGQAAKPAREGLPTDWTHHHLIFSRPATFEKIDQITRDPRYWQQWYRQNVRPVLLGPAAPGDAPHINLRRGGKSAGAWSEFLGSGGTVGAGNYPAKYSFLISGANCDGAAQPDYVVFNTGLLGSATQASVVAFDNLYSGCNGLALGSAANFAVLGASTVTNTGNSVVTGANIGISPGTSLTGFPPGVLTPPATEQLGNATASQAQADASTAFTHYNGLTGATLIGPTVDGMILGPGLYKTTATLNLSAGATLTLSGSGTYIFQIGTGFNVSGTVVLTDGATAGNVLWVVGSSAVLSGTSSVSGTILALTSISLAAGDSLTGRAIALNGAVTLSDNAITTLDTVPSVYWAYNTGGQILTSPALSLDGTQVAFVQTNPSLEGTLVLLKWAPTGGTVNSPVTLTAVANGAYRNCTAPCMTTIILQDGLGVPTDDRTSSVFPDYGRDVIWVGGALGWLHKITGVFSGTPAEVTSGGFPVQVNPANPNSLSSPVYDSASNNVFVGDYGGIFYRVSSTGVATASGQVDHGAGLVAGPIVDSTAEKIYVFSSSDGSTNCAGAVPCAAVFQFSPTFASGTKGTEAVVGLSQAAPPNPNPLYEGGFDSTYQASTNATGNLYVCGNTAGAPTIYQIPIAAGVMGTALTGPALTSATTGCSPVTDIPNPAPSGTPSSEWIFAGAQNSGSGNNCAAGGCLMNFYVQPWQPSTTYAKGQEVLDSNLNIEVARTPGLSGTGAPAWITTTGGSTTDHIVRWTNQGPNQASHPAWLASNLYVANAEILDSNGNVEWTSAQATSGTSTPAWSTTIDGTTTDGGITWRNLGPVATFSTAAAGGTSGIIMDNIVGSGTLAGASQVYFSTQGNQTCSTSGGSGGCAVQASQSALQ